jgi:hypothetical protein
VATIGDGGTMVFSRAGVVGLVPGFMDNSVGMVVIGER